MQPSCLQDATQVHFQRDQSCVPEVHLRKSWLYIQLGPQCRKPELDCKRVGDGMANTTCDWTI